MLLSWKLIEVPGIQCLITFFDDKIQLIVKLVNDILILTVRLFA